jgi:hypothetical protein
MPIYGGFGSTLKAAISHDPNAAFERLKRPLSPRERDLLVAAAAPRRRFGSAAAVVVADIPPPAHQPVRPARRTRGTRTGAAVHLHGTTTGMDIDVGINPHRAVARERRSGIRGRSRVETSMSTRRQADNRSTSTIALATVGRRTSTPTLKRGGGASRRALERGH